MRSWQRSTRIVLVALASFVVGAASASCSDPDQEEIDAHGSSTLIDGFGVTRFSLSLSTEGGVPRIAWAAPEETVAVRCALFRCEPDFWSKVDDDTPSHARRWMKNYADCAVTDYDSKGPTGKVTIAEMVAEEPEALSKSYATRSVRSFAIGCWSFDEADVNGASALIDLLPSSVPDLKFEFVAEACEPVPETGVTTTEGKLCEVALDAGGLERALGTCAGGTCNVICSGPSTCCGLNTSTELSFNFRGCTTVDKAFPKLPSALHTETSICSIQPDLTECSPELPPAPETSEGGPAGESEAESE